MADELIRLKVDRDFSLMSWLLPAPIRPDVRALGRFVRLAEGIAATPILSRRERHARLVALEAMLDASENSGANALAPGDEAVMTALRDSLQRHEIAPDGVRRILRTLHQTLLAATSGTSVGRRNGAVVLHDSWSDVMAYGTGVAAPVGRQMLALCGENPARCGPPADALCIALHVLKELRDCDNPISHGALLCIPVAFMRDASITLHHLSAPSARGQTRAVLDRVLDGVDALLLEAAALSPRVASRRLRIYVGVVLCRARKLAARCRRGDPLQERIELSGWERRSCVWMNMLRGVTARRSSIGSTD